MVQEDGVGMLRVKNWHKFQHYSDRCPPWIKLQTDTFQNPDFTRLQAASKLLALCIWTLASRSKDGFVEDDFDYIIQWGFLVGQAKKEHLQELVDKGFIIRDSEMLAEGEQVASPETEQSRAETEAFFAELWLLWPRKDGGKAATMKKFASSTKGYDQSLVVERARSQVEVWKAEKKDPKYVPYLQTWLSQKRFDTEPVSTAPLVSKPAFISGAEQMKRRMEEIQ